MRRSVNPIIFPQINIGAEATPYTDQDVTASIFYGAEGWEGTVYVAEHATETSEGVTSAGTGLVCSSYENAQTLPVENAGNLQGYEEPEVDDPLMEQLAAEMDAVKGKAQYQKGTMVSVAFLSILTIIFSELLVLFLQLALHTS